MNNRTSDNQSVILSAIKKLEASLRSEIRRGDNALRAEMKSGHKAIRQEALKVEERVENLEEGQKRMEKTINKISIQLDGFVGNVGELTEENVIATEHYRDHDLPAIALLRQLQAGKRISKLEKTATPA
ncbi:MAG: hypothetical protein HY426_00400 [Candidatus Levybacteria bacterium]|nr:hypothetical protein [Candidatus Levybacteria bacterium]